MKYITVFMPVFNGEEFLEESLLAIEHQELPVGYELEILVIDSGSSDDSLKIIRKHDAVTLLQIPNSEFSHGGTRDKASKMAKGEFILFITQDATPASNRWLINMIEPFFISEKVGCVFGCQIPRPNAPATIKREVSTVFNSLGTYDSIVIHRQKSLVDQAVTNPLNAFFSDANSAVRVDLLTGDVPFRPVKYSEDQLLAQDMLAKGYLKVYSPAGAVIHSNQYSARQYLKRKYDETIGIQDSLDINLSIGKKELVFGTIKSTVADWLFIAKDKDYSILFRFKQFFLSPFYNLNMRLGILFGTKYRSSKRIKRLFSLEDRARSKALNTKG
jgi:rhamnosyltransferase